MFSNKLICLLFTSLINFMLAAPAKAQKEDLSQVWPAKWIMPQNAPAKAYSVHHFRRTFFLDSLPSALVVHSSGDMRYQFFVNGRQVCWGPLRGDLRHWYYESTDIAPYLVEGRNVLAVLVLNYGAHPPDAQLSVQTGFVLAADDRNFRFLNSGREWKAMHNRAYSPNKVDREQVAGYYGGGSREQVDGRLYPWGWQDPSYDDSAWMPAELIENAYAKSCKWASRWKLTARELPHERLGPERFESVRLPDGIEIPPPFPQKPEGFTIPAFSRGSFVLDRGHLTTAYPVLSISGGRDSKMTFRLKSDNE